VPGHLPPAQELVCGQHDLKEDFRGSLKTSVYGTPPFVFFLFDKNMRP
jgi:hypothetical protein